MHWIFPPLDMEKIFYNKQVLESNEESHDNDLELRRSTNHGNHEMLYYPGLFGTIL